MHPLPSPLATSGKDSVKAGSTPRSQQYAALGMRGGLGKTLLTAFLLLAIVPLGLLAFATYNQIQTKTRDEVLDSLETMVALEEAHLVDWATGCERELGLLAGLCGGDTAALDSEALAADEACTVHAAAWLAETQAVALVLVQGGGNAIQVVAENDEMLGPGGKGLTDTYSLCPSCAEQAAALRDGVAAGELVAVQGWNGGTAHPPLLAIGYGLPDGGTQAAVGGGAGVVSERAAGQGEQYLVALFPWQALQRLIGVASGDDRANGTIRVSLITGGRDSGFRVFDLRETPAGSGSDQEAEPSPSEGDVGQKVAGGQGIEQALPYAALETGSGALSDNGSGLYANQAGVPVLGAYRWNSRLRAAVVAEQSQAEVLAAGNTLTAVLVAITLGMALVTAAIAAVVTRQVTRPIVQLTETAARMARGDLDQRVVVTRQDEIGVLARAFNRMSAELRVLYADLNAKVEFLTNMSHALRTPLTSIIGFSRLMLKELDGPLTELQRTDLAAIHEGGQQLLELINDMLELSDVELETAPMMVDEVDLAVIVDGVSATARALVLNKPVELIVEVADDLPTLYTDMRRVRRALLAMVSNAIRITDEGTIRLLATAGDGQVMIRVQAIGAKRQAEIFGRVLEPPCPEGDLRGTSGTRPADTSGTRDSDSSRSSFGLTISRQMVEKLGGQIWVESDGTGDTQRRRNAAHATSGTGPASTSGTGESAGSVFVFTLPISPSDRYDDKVPAKMAGEEMEDAK